MQNKKVRIQRPRPQEDETNVTAQDLREHLITQIEEEQQAILELGEGIVAGDEDACTAASEHVRRIIGYKSLLKALRPTWRERTPPDEQD